MPTNNIQPRVKISLTKNSGKKTDITPEKSVNSQQARLHNASTPKIRGNGQYKRHTDDGEAGKGEKEQIAPLQSSPRQRSRPRRPDLVPAILRSTP